MSLEGVAVDFLELEIAQILTAWKWTWLFTELLTLLT